MEPPFFVPRMLTLDHYRLDGLNDPIAPQFNKVGSVGQVAHINAHRPTGRHGTKLQQAARHVDRTDLIKLYDALHRDVDGIVCRVGVEQKAQLRHSPPHCRCRTGCRSRQGGGAAVRGIEPNVQFFVGRVGVLSTPVIAHLAEIVLHRWACAIATTVHRATRPATGERADDAVVLVENG